jgi:Protein of unknown function (DUF3800)
LTGFVTFVSGFTAYIDESGCDGFDFGNGSSEFLVLGAVICRTENLYQFDEAVARVRLDCRKPADWYFKSFKKLNNAKGQRWAIASRLAELRLEVVAVAVHKPSLSKEGWQRNKEDLYFQATKFLLERISWSCRDSHEISPVSDPVADIIFSKRGGLRYSELCAYMRTLRSDPQKYATKADWHHLDPDRVRDESHDISDARHSAVDHFVSGLGAAFERKEYGMFDDRYVRLWADRFYRPNGRAIGNGLKVWPNAGYDALREDARGDWMKVSLKWGT